MNQLYSLSEPILLEPERGCVLLLLNMGNRLQELCQKKAVDKEIASLQSTISLLQRENVELKNQLRIDLTKKSQKVDILQRNMEAFFRDLLIQSCGKC